MITANRFYARTCQSDFARTPALARYAKYGGNVLQATPDPVCQSCGDIFVLERYDNKLCATCGHEMVEDQQQRYAAE